MISVCLQFPYLLLFYFLLLVLLDTSQADKIRVIWGQSSAEGSLGEICATGKYSYLNIRVLPIYVNRLIPELNLESDCKPFPCTSVSSDIRNCQKQGITVMLSVEPEVNVTSEDAKFLSGYLWNNFLGGNSSSRPFGDAILDGINFATNSYSIFWMDIARYLKSYNTTQKIYLSVDFMCGFNHYGKSTLNSGLYDYIIVMFMKDPSCHYNDGNPTNLISSWNQWTKLKLGKIFLMLPVSPNATGYIPTDLLNSQILPIIRKSSNYGGIFLNSGDDDRLSAYSDSIINPLCKHQNQTQCSGRDDISFTESFGYMSMASFRVNESKVISHHCCELICRNNCSCNAYAQTNSTGCQIWSKESIFNRSLGSKGLKIYVLNKGGQGHTDVKSSKSNTVAVIWIITSMGVGLALTFICCFTYALWRKYKAKVDTRNRQKRLIQDIGGTAMLSMMNYTNKKIRKEPNTSDEIEIFSFESMVTATNNFSAFNKLGEGGFGLVYMGRLTNQ